MGLFSSSSSSAPKNMFFVIYFAEHVVRAALWQVIDGYIEVILTSTPQQALADAEVIDAADAALQELGQESESVHQTLFALEPTWVSQQGILADKKQLFQQLTKELALEAAGFVVIPEAIVQHALYAHGKDFECFVLEVMSQRVYVTQLKNGKLGQQEMMARTTNLVEDISEAFGRFHDVPLPSSMILYSSQLSPEEIQECGQRLTEIDLPSKYAFTSPVEVETLNQDQIMEVVIQTGGRAVAESRGLIGPADFTPQPLDGVGAAFASEGNESEDDVENGEDASQVLDNEPALELSDEHDLATAALTSTIPTPVTPTHKPHHEAPMRHPQPQYQDEYYEEHRGDGTLLFGRFHLPHHPVLFSVFGLIIGALLLGGIFFFASAKLLTANVQIVLKTSHLTKQLELKLDPTAVVSDPVAGKLKAEILKQTVTGTKEADTTGKKLIGDKAKGKVTIFNRTSSSKSFPAGTVIQTDKFKYLLDQAVTVASASTGQNFETKPGTVEATVTAAAIGAESNIGADIEMTIDTFAKDTYIARSATGGMTGGTSREIKAVSQKDLDELSIALKKELSQQAAKQLQEQVGQGKYVFPTNTIKVTSSKFSAELGKETNEITLDLTVEAQALSYSSAEIQQLATQVMTQDVPAGYALPKDGIEVLTQPTTTASQSAQVNITAQLSANAKPTVDPNTWKQELAGKTETEAKETLQKKPEIEKFILTRRPVIFARFTSSMPKDADKITIQAQ